MLFTMIHVISLSQLRFFELIKDEEIYVGSARKVVTMTIKSVSFLIYFIRECLYMSCVNAAGIFLNKRTQMTKQVI
jgi:hypothetical protein